MILPRYTIRSLLLIVLFVGVAFAALRSSNDAWDAGIFGLTLLVLLTAILLAFQRIERRRAYWLGSALFGWIYLAASLIPPVESRLPTTKGLTFIDSKMPRKEPASFVLYKRLVLGLQGQASSSKPVALDLTRAGTADWAYTWMLTGKALSGPDSTTENFVRIGHSLLALVLAAVGGWLSRKLHDRNEVGTTGGYRPRA